MSDAVDNKTAMHILAGIAGILSEYKPAGVDSSNVSVDSSNAGVDSSNNENREKSPDCVQQQNMNNCKHEIETKGNGTVSLNATTKDSNFGANLAGVLPILVLFV